jgi:AcrR family transcriptional regulator
MTISPTRTIAMMIPRTNAQRRELPAPPCSGLGAISPSLLWYRGGSAIEIASTCLISGTTQTLSRQSVAVNSVRRGLVVAYTSVVPRLWTETIETHRREVRDAIVDTTAALVAEHGLRSVTMSQIAEETGIGRATLYKYFPDVESILRTWHERQIAGHLEYLAEVRDQATEPGERLEAVLEAFALVSRDPSGHHDTEFAALLHGDEQVARAQHQVHLMIRDLLAEAAQTGDVRDDVSPGELAGYCVHALTGASTQHSKAAVRRLVMVTMAGLRPPP